MYSEFHYSNELGKKWNNWNSFWSTLFLISLLISTNSVLEPWILWLTIKRFHSHGWHLCKFIGTKENVCIRKEFNPHMSGLGHQHGRRFIVLIGLQIWPPWRHVKTLYKAFSLTWPAALQIYWKNSKFLRKKKVQLIRDFIGSPTWPPFPCFERWQYPGRDVMWKYFILMFLYFCKKLQSPEF